jgi:hypothetical protein
MTRLQVEFCAAKSCPNCPLLHRPCQAVELPHDQRVDVTQIAHHLGVSPATLYREADLRPDPRIDQRSRVSAHSIQPPSFLKGDPPANRVLNRDRPFARKLPVVYRPPSGSGRHDTDCGKRRAYEAIEAR